MKVDLTYLEEIRNYLKEVNDLNLEDIVWVRDGIEIVYNEDYLKEFSFMGLNNIDFLSIYKGGF